MSASAQRSLRVLAGAFVAGALAIILQTTLLLAVAWDSPSYGAMRTVVRLLFVLADGALVYALLAAARTSPAARGALRVASALAAISVLEDLASFSGTPFSAGELSIAVGVTVLTMIALRAIVPSAVRGRTALTITIGVVAAATIVLRLASDGAPSPAFAWSVWLITVAWPLLVAVLVGSAARALSAGVAIAIAPQTPYRDAAMPAKGLAPIDRALRPALEKAHDALGSYLRVLVVRFVLTFVTGLLAIGAGAGGVKAGPAIFVLALFPGASGVTAVMLVRRLGKARAVLAEALELRGALPFAIFALGASALLDGVVLLAAVAFLADDSYRAASSYGGFVVVEGLLATLCSLAAGYGVATALRRASLRLGEPLAAQHARTLLSSAITVLVLFLASFGALISGSAAGPVMALFFSIAALVFVILALVSLGSLVGVTRAALRRATSGG